MFVSAALSKGARLSGHDANNRGSAPDLKNISWSDLDQHATFGFFGSDAVDFWGFSVLYHAHDIQS